MRSNGNAALLAAGQRECISMTEYELSRLLLESFIGNSVPAIGLYLAIVTVYLTAALTVGRKLAHRQVWLVNLLFIVFCLFAILAWLTRYELALRYQAQLKALNPDSQNFATQETAVVSVLIFLVLAIGSLKFMWDIRNHRGGGDR
jgi:hypothetical protein